MHKNILVFTSCVLFFSCTSAVERLQAPRSPMNLRIDTIRELTDTDPVQAIHLIQAFNARYGTESIQGADDDTVLELVAGLEHEAVHSLEQMKETAVTEKRWKDVRSFERSLAALGQSVPSLAEGESYLMEALDALAADEILGAFLAAVRAHEINPLSAEHALLFLEAAVSARQRRSAAYFLQIAEQGGAEVPRTLRLYAEGHDTASDMIKGVATVLVDRGIRIENGRGLPDRVIGSAFFIDSSGLLITNYHVISSEVDPEYEGYSRMYIRLGDSSSSRIPARVVGWDKVLDLALIKAEIEPEYVFSLLGGIVPQVGETVLAIGSPGGLEKTVTSGIVSALGRRFLQIGDVIQIDAAVNQGNSGGPVVDAAGRLIGVVFAGIQQFEGTNFAVPAKRLLAALPRMLEGGEAARSWLGLTIAESRDGIEIIYIAPSTPAADILLPEEVLISSVNGNAVSDLDSTKSRIVQLQDIVFATEPGELLSVQTADGNTYLLMSAARPSLPLAEAAKKDSRERLAVPLFGLFLSPSFGGPLDPAFMVKRVIHGSIADEAGLSELDPLSVQGFHVDEEIGLAYIDISVKKRRAGYLETMMRLPAAIDIPDTL